MGHQVSGKPFIPKYCVYNKAHPQAWASGQSKQGSLKHILRQLNREPSSFLLSTSLRKRHIFLLLSTSHLHWILQQSCSYAIKERKGELTWTTELSLWTGCPNPAVIPYCRNSHYFTGELKKLPKVLQPTSIGSSTALLPHGNVWPNNAKQYGTVHSVSISECWRVSEYKTLEPSNYSYKKSIKLGNRHKEQGYTLLTVHK